MATRRFSKLMSLAALTALISAQTLVFADSTLPSDVENLEAFPGDKQVTLTWDPSTDDTGVEGYFLYSGTSSVADHGGSYSFGSQDVGNLTSYVMKGLDNNTSYYFAVTAYDAAGNESEYYSFEAEATPEAGGTVDNSAPKLDGITVVTNTLLELEFSEDVVLPDEPSDAFDITDTDGAILDVLDAYVSSDDESTVFVVTAEQAEGAVHTLVVTDRLLDKAGNAANNQSDDFNGVSNAATEETNDLSKERSDNFEISDIEVVSENEIIVIFNEDVRTAEADAFSLFESNDSSEEVDVLAVNIDPEDARRVSLLTESMDAGLDYELSIDDSLENMNMLALSRDGDAMEFTANTLNFSDLIAPEDISNLLAQISGETNVKLSWTGSADTAGDLAKYLIYKTTTGDAAYGTGISVAKDLASYTFSGLTPGESYTFKVTAVDENGNESEGVLKTVVLPEAGPGMLLIGGASLFGAGFVTRRKRRF